jgi:NAD(P)-dependent dehydrogenase (short-subunit alcohol dehydrogenase family)
MMVTGGSRGIGAATARLAAGRGWDVCISYMSDSDAASEVVADCRAAGVRAEAVRADISREADVMAMFAAADDLGPLAALANNAGTLERACRLDEFDVGRLRRVFELNVVGAIVVLREAVRRMSTRHGGRGGAIVNVSSAAAYLGSPNEYIDYAASKGALDTVTIGLSKEVAAEGIRVNGVRPGLIYTDIHARSGIVDRVDRLAPTTPMQRGGQPHEVAGAIVWLLSDAASYVTGTFVNCAGGR